MSTFANLEIRILAAQETGYPVEMRLHGQHFDGWVDATLAEVRDGRQLLAQLLSDPEINQGWEQARAQSEGRRRIRLWLDAPELQGLPWEQLCEDTWIAANAATPFSRYLPLSIPWGQAVTERPLRVLVAISNPHDLTRYSLAPLDVAKEKQMLEQALEKLAHEQVALSFLEPPVTLTRLEAAVREGYHILHYLGHGSFNQRQRQAALYLQDEAGNTQIVRDDQLGEMLARQGVRPRLVFLGACQSATQASGDAFSGLAQKLIQAGVPAVVAMQDKVSIETTRVFSRTFYERLAEHGTVDLALNEARSTLVTGERLDAAVPVLFMRLDEGQIFSDLSEDKPLGPLQAPPPPPFFVPSPALAEVKRILLQSTTTVPGAITGVVLHGMGGVGKSTVARVLARDPQVRAHFPDGVLWAELRALDGPEEDARLLEEQGSWLEALDDLAYSPQDVERTTQRLRTQLQGKRMLLIIDDAWQLRHIKAFLVGDGASSVLITTRDQELVAGLALSEVSVEMLSPATAQQMLTKLFPSASDTPAATVQALVERLEGLPLAIELAGKLAQKRSRRPGWQLADLYQKIEQRLADPVLRLKGHPGLNATFSLSYEALDSAAQQLFCTLGKLLPVPLRAAAVALLLDEPEDTIQDRLEQLIDLSLGQWHGTTEPWYTMHSLLHEYAEQIADQLPAKWEQQEFTLAQNGWQALAVRVADPEQAKTALESLYLLNWCQLPEPVREAACRSWPGYDLDFFAGVKDLSWTIHYNHPHQQNTLTDVLNRALASTTDRACQALGLWAKSVSEIYQTAWEQALSTTQEAMGLYRELNDSAKYIALGTNQIYILVEKGDYQQADQYAAALEAYMLTHSSEAEDWRYLYHHWLLAKIDRHDLLGIKTLLEKAFPLIADEDRAGFLVDAIYAYLLLQDYDQAQKYIAEIEPAYQAQEDVYIQALLKCYQAEILQRTGQPAKALNFAEAAIALYGVEESSVMGLRRADILVDLKRYADALTQLNDAAPAFTTALDYAQAALIRARAYLGLSNCPAATAALQESQTHFAEVSPYWSAVVTPVARQLAEQCGPPQPD